MEKIKTGVVGYGFSGQIFQCPFIEAHQAFDLVAVVQRHGDSAKEDYPEVSLYRDYESLLEDASIELIVIATPAHLHYDHGMKALAAGKHVVIEKPFATSLQEAQDLKALAIEKNKLAVAYQNRRYDGDFLTIKALVNDPAVHIYEFEAVWDRFVPVIEDNWHESGYQGSDLLFDLGPHYLDQALSLFGQPLSWHGRAKKLREASRIIDYFSIELEYSELVVRLKSSLIAPKADVRFKLHTNQGTYYFYEMGEQEHQLIAGLKPNDEAYGDKAMYDLFNYEGEKSSGQVVKGNYLAYFSQLAKAIRQGGQPPVTLDEGVRVVEMLSHIRDHMVIS